MKIPFLLVWKTKKINYNNRSKLPMYFQRETKLHTWRTTLYFRVVNLRARAHTFLNVHRKNPRREKERSFLTVLSI